MSLISVPLDESRINYALNSAYWRVRVVKETGSTQKDLALEVSGGKSANGDVLVAEFQSAGRGRLSRNFIAPSGSGLLFSFLITPRNLGHHGDDASSWGWLPLLVSQAVITALQRELRVKTGLSLKWPNDILLNRKKIGGVLCEVIKNADGFSLIVGIGLNIYTLRDQLPVAHATSLFLEGFNEVNRESLLVSILQNMTNYLKRWEINDPALVDEYVAYSSTIGEFVRAEMPAGVTHEARAVGIEATGSLVLDDGRVISVGDIIHLHSK